MAKLVKPSRIIEVKDKRGRVTKYTNKHNLPPEVVAAILKDRYNDPEEEESDYSASRLVQPVLKTVLEGRYRDTGKLKIFDVIDQFHSFKGAVGHQVMEDSWHESMGGVVEERLYMVVRGKSVSGKMDRWHSGKIKDYKNTAVYKIMKGDFLDWEIQQNIYAQLCRENNWPIESIEIIAMLDNWKEGETYKQGYPEVPIVVLSIPLWDEGAIKAWIDSRVKDVEYGKGLSDEMLAQKFPCSDKERWANFRDWCVIRKGGQKATAVFPDEKAGEQMCIDYIKEKGWEESHEIQKRVDPPKRCMKYCAAATVCPLWLKENQTEEAEEKPLF